MLGYQSYREVVDENYDHDQEQDHDQELYNTLVHDLAFAHDLALALLRLFLINDDIAAGCFEF